MKHVAITGAAGFIGSHLCDAYLFAGWRVTGIDDLSTGSLDNLAGALSSERFSLVRGDAGDASLLEPIFAGADLVFHLAARIGLKLVIASPLKTLESNATGTEAVLRIAAAAGVRTVLASTSEIYGMTEKFPSNEEDPVSFGPPSRGRWSYACSKAYDEALALAHQRENGLPATVVRLFNTVGPRQSAHYGMVIPRLVRQALAGEPLTVYGDGTQTRCFCHVAEVVWALRRLAETPAAVGEVVNVGNPHEVSILELAAAVLRLTGSKSAIERIPFDRAYGTGFEEILRRVPDIGKARTLIGFAPSRGLDDVVRDVIAEVSS